MLKLNVKINLSLAGIPTITSTNKVFYDNYINSKCSCNKALDEIKHGKYKDARSLVKKQFGLMDIEFKNKSIPNITLKTEYR